MKFLDFFNPLDIDHLRAYQHLQKKGNWPESFLDWDTIEFEPNWILELQSKMANLWVGSNIFMHKMRPTDQDTIIDLEPLLKIADNFDKKRKKNV